MSDDNEWGWIDEPDEDEYSGDSFYVSPWRSLFGELTTRTPRYWGNSGYVEPDENATPLDRVESRAQTIIDQRQAARESQEAQQQRELEASFAQTLADLREIPTTDGVKWLTDETGARIAVLL